MASDDPPVTEHPLEQAVRKVDRYPIEAFHFVQQGLSYTVEKLHGGNPDPDANRHVTGQQLCHGLREFALMRWGLLARTVLCRWNINSTHDFGLIVYAMIEHGLMNRTEQDSLEDFRDVYGFRTAFEADYRISLEPAQEMREVKP
jgi:uncharacterized repeat protein (TIGR04138 family)